MFKLLRKDVEWRWGEEQQECFIKLKNRLSTTPVLMLYDISLPIKLDCDASSYGLGVVLSHILLDGSEKPISFASRTLNSSERRYSQVDKEGAAVIFGLKKFQQYLLGRHFQLVVDNKAIARILPPENEMQGVAANRLTRWSIIMAMYDYEIMYRKSNLHANADMLSRLPLYETVKPSAENLLHSLQIGSVPITPKEIRIQTKQDPSLKKVIQYLETDSWPSKVSPDLKPYAGIKDELSVVEGGIIMWGLRVVIPPILKDLILQELHHSHPGIVRMKALARIHCWYPNINRDVEDLVNSCDKCKSVLNVASHVTPHPMDWPSNPMERVHLDFFGPFYEHNCLILADAYSGWIEVQIIKNMNAGNTLKILQRWFSRYGLPNQIVTDSGTQFTSDQFQSFI